MVKEKINVLFVCTGNICRSPIAEYLFRRRLGPNLHWEIGSAGLAAVDGLPASQTAIEVMNEIGIDLKPHRSREFTPELIDAATIILAMTGSQVLETKKRFPKARDRVHLLGSFSRDSERKDISDPLGADIEVYRRTRDDIAGCLAGLINYLKAYEKA